MSTVPRSTPTREVPTTRALRGHRLASERFEEIVQLRPGVYSVPSCTGDHAYLVDLKADTCSCEDSIFGDHVCKHIFAARIIHSKTTTCAGCGERVRLRDAVEVMDYHESLAFFEGDLVCESCPIV